MMFNHFFGMSLVRTTFILLALLNLVACGGGGGSSDTPIPSTPQSSAPAVSSISSANVVSSSSTSTTSFSSASLSSSSRSSSSATSSSSFSSLSSASSSSSLSVSAFLMGGAVQKQPLNLTGVASTFAGAGPGTDGIGTEVAFTEPTAITGDGTNLYVTDAWNHTIRKIVIATGAVTTLAGTPGIHGVDDGLGTMARFFHPQGITTDGTNLYVADTWNNAIRKIVIATGVVTTLATTPFSDPAAIATDGTNLYVAGFYSILKISIATGVVNTLAGMDSTKGSVDGTGTAARFNSPNGIAIDSTNLYVTDTSNHTIRKIVITTGVVTTIAGTAEVAGAIDGVGTAASFHYPKGITTDGTNLYVANSGNHTIRKIVIATSEVSTLAGTAGVGGSLDGTLTAASFLTPSGIYANGANLYLADSENNLIRKVSLISNAVTTLAGNVGVTNGIGVAASFRGPVGITTDGINLYATDAGSSTIRKIVIATGAVTTFAGTAGAYGSNNGIRTAARFQNPQGITTDGINLYVADSANQTVRKIVIATGEVSTLAGTVGVNGSADGLGAVAKFFNPVGITTDNTNLYVADANNHTIRKIVIATGAVTTFAGTGIEGKDDGYASSASFDNPTGITTDGTTIFVADYINSSIRKIVIATGEVTTLAGSSWIGNGADGYGQDANFALPSSLTTDGTYLYVTDSGNSTIRKITISTGLVTTIAGAAGLNGNLDGTATTARFNWPLGITTDGFDLFVTDINNKNIRKIH